jgi:hypothetical protein
MAATKAKEMENITFHVEPKPEKKEEVRVRIKLPLREEDDPAAGLNVDHYEHVTISNELGEETVYVKRGEWVDVTTQVFTLLRQRYPDI